MSLAVHKRARAIIETYEIAERIAQDDPDAGERFIDAVEDSCRFLGDFPESGDVVRTRKKRLRDVRLWQVKEFRNYIVLYRTTATVVEILTVFHGARNLLTIIRSL
jgi:plasmid stabilization system protein ParE